MLLKSWWKILSFVLLIYTCTMGFLVKIPVLDDRMQQSVRNLFFHVPMWFCMQTLFIISAYLCHQVSCKTKPAIRSLFFRICTYRNSIWRIGFNNRGNMGKLPVGRTTGSGDPKQNGAAIALLIYLAYFVLRGSVTDENQACKVREQCIIYLRFRYVISNNMDITKAY